ncbi:MAG TPA: twin-arginine translocation signal domain-containing protein, partial [Rhizomicrobium sp.]|nr:twin-arginine translocation signal domain-containing protein [Rhizomicrobium sp.]
MNSIQAPDRRLFVQGLAAAGVAGLAAPVHAREAPGTHPVLRGKDLDLTLAEMPVNITGRRRI